MYRSRDCSLLNSSGEVILLTSSDFIEADYLNIAIPEKLSGAITSRQIEFQKGRYLAKSLLSMYGSHKVVSIGKNREPLWPDGFVGSISHCKGYFVAVVSPKEFVNGVGVDIEEVGRVKKELSRMIRTDEDIIDTHLKSTELNTLIFSAKESLYKMLYPSVKQFFGFKDAALISVEENSFSIQLLKTLSAKHNVGDVYNGRFILTDKFILSYLEY